ncbi:hypothetical protein GCM10007924_31510 [Sneathiella chinensis]|uniref:Uncharacterized protein n=1 Tax=Sneathiella chinensis TaxID=349750 RepID=A0ABQ5U9K0_9PROT|nr:hypothetical protein GCM10007924_31510 [Sneathiella chinensis]
MKIQQTEAEQRGGGRSRHIKKAVKFYSLLEIGVRMQYIKKYLNKYKNYILNQLGPFVALATVCRVFRITTVREQGAKFI